MAICTLFFSVILLLNPFIGVPGIVFSIWYLLYSLKIKKRIAWGTSMFAKEELKIENFQ